MRCVWLGQAGLLFDFDGVKVMADPYFSDGLSEKLGYPPRRVAVERRYLEIRPDILLLSHDHLDHTDPETLDIILKKWEGICVLASQNAWKHARMFGGNHNYVLFNRHTEWTQGSLWFRAVHAQHSDNDAVGFIIRHQEKVYYITGDTLYHSQVIEDVRTTAPAIDVVFLPVNGLGNNMNMVDAARFAEEIHAKKVVPLHFGLYDVIDPKKEFCCSNKIVPSFFQEIQLTEE